MVLLAFQAHQSAHHLLQNLIITLNYCRQKKPLDCNTSCVGDAGTGVAEGVDKMLLISESLSVPGFIKCIT